MQAIKCEMCNSSDVIKQDGLYVCQSCGTKYTVEEAKKLMIDGTVDVSGSTVKIDNSPFVAKYLANARRAKAKEDWEETEKYYNLVEQNDPTNIEAIFYSSYGKAKASLVDSDLYKRQAVFKVLQNCVSIVDDNFNLEIEEEDRDIIKQISTDIFALSASNFVFNQRKNGYGVIVWTDRNETQTLFNNMHAEYITTLNNIIEKYGEERKADTLYIYPLLNSHYNYLINFGQLANAIVNNWKNKQQAMHVEWHKLDPTHEIPLPQVTVSNAKKSGCYVATAVYGSYDCPEVWTLRRYRDYSLASNVLGRSFIRLYYAVSPALVKRFGEKSWFRNYWRKRLDRMVKKLNAKGVDNTPYEDKNW